MFFFKKGNSKEKKTYIRIDTSISLVYSFTDVPTAEGGTPHEKMAGMVIGREGDFLVRFAGPGDATFNPIFVKDQVISVYYVELKTLYTFTAEVVSIRAANDFDNIDPDYFKNISVSFPEEIPSIIEVRPLTEPVRAQRREYFRMPLGIIMYCNDITDIDEVNSIDVKLDPEKAVIQKVWADTGVLESDGYKKFKTIDISAGGFGAKVRTFFNENDFLECIIILDNEALTTIAQIISCRKDPDIDDLFYIRCKFYRISDAVRDKIMKYILKQQRVVKNRIRKTF